MKKILRPIYRKLYDASWAIGMLLWTIRSKKTEKIITNQHFTIGITTYIARFDQFFKPLIHQLTTLFPETQFVIAINGYYDQEKQQNYLIEINRFLAAYKNIKTVQFEAPQSLSKLWNVLIINSTTPKTIILNDDLKILPWFRKEMERTNFIVHAIQLINRSWSHFIISKQIVSQIGWFDERFPGIGNEDEDYETRLALNSIHIQSSKIRSINNLVINSNDFSYGNSIAVINGKYVKANKDFFDQKWEQSKVPKDGFTYVEILKCYLKLKEGMETPNFYH